MLRAWLLKKTGGVRVPYAYTNSWGGQETAYKSVFDFSECLKEAWKIEKGILETKNRPVEPVYITQEAYNSFYANTKYFGD